MTDAVSAAVSSTVSSIGSALDAELSAARQAMSASAPSQDFSTVIDREFGQLNTQLLGAEAGMRDLASGRAASLHQVMADVEGARLSIQLMMQVRTRILESYQELMRMQV